MSKKIKARLVDYGDDQLLVNEAEEETVDFEEGMAVNDLRDLLTLRRDSDRYVITSDGTVSFAPLIEEDDDRDDEDDEEA